MSITRRNFLAASASLAGGLFIVRTCLGQAPTTAPGVILDFAPPGEMKSQYFGAFSELPVGAVAPRGWIKDWLQRQVDGLTGHPENLAYPYDTCMYAGKIPPPPVAHGQSFWPYEQSAYFLDGAVRLSHLIDDPLTRKISEAGLQYIFAHSGPAKIGESTFGWANAVAGRALMAQYSATGDVKAAQVLNTCVLGTRGIGGRDGDIAEEAFYLYGLTGDQRHLDLAKRAYNSYFISDTRSFSHIDKIRGTAPLREHGVTAAEQLKLLPLMYAYTGDAQALELAKLAYRKVEADSLMPDGGIVSSESMSTTAFNSLHETCDITDWSWSFGYMLLASGEGHWADLIERATFNALPGAVTKDFKQLQYFSGANQVLASSTCCPRIAMTRMSYRTAHETECCSGNVNRAMPNYVARMWMRAADGLAAALYGPCEVRAKVGGKDVSITEETDYPFRETISFKVKLAQPVSFTLHLRIPEWCQASAISVNGNRVLIETNPGTFAAVQREFRDGDVVTLRLPMAVALQDWFGGKAVSVRRGPLVYALKIEEKRVESKTEPDAIRRVLKGNNVQGFPAVEFFPESEWRYGMEARLKKSLEQITMIEAPMPANPFVVETVPVRLSLQLRPLPQWAATWKAEPNPPPANLAQSPQNPATLPGDGELQAAGAGQSMTLVPYGATHLRLTTLPVIPG